MQCLWIFSWALAFRLTRARGSMLVVPQAHCHAPRRRLAAADAAVHPRRAKFGGGVRLVRNRQDSYLRRSRISGCAEPHNVIMGQPPRLLPRTRSTSPVGFQPIRRDDLSDLRLKVLIFVYASV